jgi:hypothetical protein
MRVDSIQSVMHTLLDKVLLERVFYGHDQRTGATVTQSITYTVEVYNNQGKIEQSQRGGLIDLRV